MKYRSEIDGLRALAVLPVILFHAGFSFASGGYVGVDVFFVISGYLITSILVKNCESGKFSLLTFYNKRARRILPALYAAIIPTTVAALLFLTPSDLVSYSKSLIATFSFVSNFFFAFDINYFAPSSEFKPLLHTWSLSVEEQYYFFFPLFVFALYKRKAALLYTTASLTFLSILASVYSTSLVSVFPSLQEFEIFKTTQWLFFFTPARVWEIFAGALVALTLKDKDLKSIASPYLSGLGVLLILGTAAVYTKNTPSPGLYTLLPVIGTCLIIAFSSGDHLVKRFLSNRALVHIGLISYSLYLWHQPILAFNRILNPVHTHLHIAICILITFLGAHVSWKYIEAPFRDFKKVSNTQVLYLFLASFLFIFFGAYTVYSDGFPERLGSPSLIKELDRKLQGEYTVKRFEKYKDKSFATNTPEKPKLLLIGDSYAQDLTNVLYEAGQLSDLDFSTFYIPARCGNLNIPFNEFKRSVARKNRKYCQKRHKTYYESQVLKNKIKQADFIIFASAWQKWHTPFILQSLSNTSKLNPTAKILTLGKKQLSFKSPLISRHNARNKVRPSEIHIMQTMSTLFDDKKNKYLDLQKALCSSYSSCPVFTSAKQDHFISYDGGHLTEAGAKYTAKILAPHFTRFFSSSKDAL
ncbi:MAG: acyltransferase family protein [Bdellovibrionales bacterium]